MRRVCVVATTMDRLVVAVVVVVAGNLQDQTV